MEMYQSREVYDVILIVPLRLSCVVLFNLLPYKYDVVKQNWEK